MTTVSATSTALSRIFRPGSLRVARNASATDPSRQAPNRTTIVTAISPTVRSANSWAAKTTIPRCVA